MLEPGGTGVVKLLFETQTPEMDVVLVGTNTPSIFESRRYRVPEGSLEFSMRVHIKPGSELLGESLEVLSTSLDERVSISFGDPQVPGQEKQLRINEIYAGDGVVDANCDGIVGANDAYVEIYNPGADALDLGGISLWEHRSGGELRTIALAGSIGPGEVRFVMASEGATADCLPTEELVRPLLTPSGDAAFYEIYREDTSTSIDQLTVRRGVNASSALVPDFSDQDSPHPLVDATGFAASPGTRVDGSAFAADGVLEEPSL
jgi:hypothetical protein